MPGKISSTVRVLITGAYGQIGLFITHKFKQAGWQVYATSHSELDICDEDAVREAVFTIRPQLIINAAAYTAVDQAEKEPRLVHQINAVAPGYLSAAAAEAGAVIIHISTDYVFDGSKQGAYLETDLPHPLNVYGASKLVGELQVIAANPHHIILRTSWVFSEQGKNFVKTMLSLAQQRKTLNIINDQYGGPTYAGDIADTLLVIANHVTGTRLFSGWGIYHYCGQPVVNWYQYAKAIFAHALQSGVISTLPEVNAISSSQYSSLAVRPLNSFLNCSKIKTVFGISQPDWQASLDAMFILLQHRKLPF